MCGSFRELVMAPASFDGLRVLSLESRRSTEMAKLIRTYGGEPFVVPAMREVPLESNRLALEFAEKLIAGSFDLVPTESAGAERVSYLNFLLHHPRPPSITRRPSTGASSKARSTSSSAPMFACP